MKKQILSIIMAGCLLLSMTACSSDKKNTKSASEQTTADTSTSTTSPQEYSKTDFVMSTVLSEKIYGTKDVTQDIKEELDKLTHFYDKNRFEQFSNNQIKFNL